MLTADPLLAQVTLQEREDSATADASAEGQDLYERSRVGTLSDGRIVVPTNQVLSPAGRQVIVDGRPTDVALSPNGRWLAVLNVSQVMLVDVESGRIVSRAPNRGSFKGIVFTPDGKRLYASSTRGNIGVFDVSDEGQLAAVAPIVLPTKSRGGRGGGALPVGLAIDPDGKSLFVAINLNNTLAEIDIRERQSRARDSGRQRAVRRRAGRPTRRTSAIGPAGCPAPGDADGPIRRRARRCASIRCGISPTTARSRSSIWTPAGRSKQIVVGLHPSGMVATPDGRSRPRGQRQQRHDLGHRHANGRSRRDDFHPARRKAALRQRAECLGDQPRRHDGSTPPTARTTPSRSSISSRPTASCLGCIPTGWYPAGLALDAKRGALYVANVKGIGSRNPIVGRRAQDQGQSRSSATTRTITRARVSLHQAADGRRAGRAHANRARQQSADRIDQRPRAAAARRRRRGPCPSGTASRRSSSTCSTSSRRTAPTTRCSATSRRARATRACASSAAR